MYILCHEAKTVMNYFVSSCAQLFEVIARQVQNT